MHSNPNIKPTEALILTAFIKILEEKGVRGYRQLIKQYGSYYWYSLNTKQKKLKNDKNRTNMFNKLKKFLDEFEPVKLVAFQDEMINNDKYGFTKNSEF